MFLRFTATNESNKMIEHVPLIIAFTAGRAFVNAGDSSGLGKLFDPIAETKRNTTIVKIHITGFTHFFSFTFDSLTILYLLLIGLPH